MSESSSVLRGRVCEDWLTSLKTSLTYVTESSDAQHASEGVCCWRPSFSAGRDNKRPEVHLKPSTETPTSIPQKPFRKCTSLCKAHLCHLCLTPTAVVSPPPCSVSFRRRSSF